MSENPRFDAGFLILADISGFTAFVTGTELEHGAEVTGRLLAAVMTHLSPPLEIQELEGDAVFALGPDRRVPDPGTVPGVLREAYIAFREEQQGMVAEGGCECGACLAIPRLDLKFVAHHGRFVRQRIDGRSRVAGSDVILVHRLLKNVVEGSAYLLLTEPALRRIGLDPAIGRMQRHLLSYPHLGEVPCFVVALDEPARTGLAPAAIGAA
jgi:hypothetical protein